MGLANFNMFRSACLIASAVRSFQSAESILPQSQNPVRLIPLIHHHQHNQQTSRHDELFLINFRAISNGKYWKDSSFRCVIPPTNLGIGLVSEKGAFAIQCLGKYLKTLTSGRHIITPFVDHITYVHSLKEATPISNQSVIRKHCVSINVSGVLHTKSQSGDPIRLEHGNAAAIYPIRGDYNPVDGSSVLGEDQSTEAEKETTENTATHKCHLSNRSNPGVVIELESLFLKEVESVMNGLGPPFVGWNGANPIPIDADMLPAIDCSFKSPLRRLPQGAKASITDIELTVLRRLSRLSPTHFVLGRNRGHQGLATAIVKLWERSEIVKIQIKKGVMHTRNQIMADELKRLTGGVLLSRDKYLIVLYRGKDFLPEAVATALSHRESVTNEIGGEEESLSSDYEGANEGLNHQVISEWANWRRLEEERKNMNAKVKAARELDARRLSHKLSVLMAKKRRAEEDLSKVTEYLNQFNPPEDREHITTEERKNFCEAGIKVGECLMFGKSSSLRVVIERMHLHWKKKELVKLHLLEFDRESAKEVVRILEHESGGIFVTMLSAARGHVIILYRGKSYDPKARTLAKTAFIRGTALKNCLRMKHQKSLERHLVAVEKEINKMKLAQYERKPWLLTPF